MKLEFNILQIATDPDPLLRAELVNIFWETNLVPPRDQAHQKSLQNKYLDFYLGHKQAINLGIFTNNQCQGYILSLPATDTEEILQLQGHLKNFLHLFLHFPAHLHINVLPHWQGRGLGRMLMTALESKLRDQGISGVHLLTSPEASNRNFYEKLGFIPTEINSGILFLGKNL